MSQRVLVVGDKKSMIATALAHGAEVWWAQCPSDLIAGETAAGEAVTLVVDYTAPEFADLVADLHRVRPFDAVVAIAENALLPAATVASRLGLRGPSERAARLLTDKPAMRAHLASAGVSPVAAAVGSSARDLLGFGATHGYPFIAKPVAATGSFGVTRVDGPWCADEVSAGFERMGTSTFLMEEYLDGPELSVESFSFGGTHVVLTLTDKLVGAGFIEAGHTMPAGLADAEWQAVVDLTRRFLDAVGLVDGPSHVEVKLTARGPRIVEGHCRRGGDRINELIRLAFGLDVEELSVLWAMGLVSAMTAPPVARGGAAIRFVSAARGLVVAVSGYDEVRSCPDVVDFGMTYGIGDLVRPLRWSLDRAAYVIAVGDSAAAAADNAESAADRIVFTVRPDDSPSDDGGRALSRRLDQARRIGYDVVAPAS